MLSDYFAQCIMTTPRANEKTNIASKGATGNSIIPYHLKYKCIGSCIILVTLGATRYVIGVSHTIPGW